MDIISIIHEYNGINKVYSVIDSRSFKTLHTCKTVEEAREKKELELQKLYKGYRYVNR